jgi:CheY-like chemotaxis protein/nitrogen-specific signal transduction histidine kinase
LVQQRTAELVLARDQAQAAEAQAEAANRAKSVFLASMSHELRTPLNAVLGFSQLMRTDASLNESQKENLDIINRSGTHLLGLINDVLEMSRIEAGRVTAEATNFDLWNTLDTIKEILYPRARAKGLRFILERAPSLPHYVRGDERKLKQVIINLAGNAVKFTQQGEIVLRAAAEKDGAILLFEVEDTGPGIDAKAIETLFESFSQGNHNQEGAGLGLFISQKLVQLMGGQMAVQSELNKGAIFSFSIPCEPVAVTEMTPKHVHRRVTSLAPGQTPPRILVAEDTPESRLLMTKTLRAVGFDVVEAENGMDAVRLFDECLPGLVLMDMRMPVMDGYEAIRRIRATRQGGATPIIAVTASAFEEDRQKILALGADNFVSKPVQVGELFEKIRLLLGIAYLYAEEQAERAEVIDQTGLAQRVAQLPADLTDELARTMAILDLDGFRALLPKVARCDLVLAENLGGLANGYRVTELVELFMAPSRSMGSP